MNEGSYDKREFKSAKYDFKNRLSQGIQDQSNKFPNLHGLYMPQVGDQFIQDYEKAGIFISWDDVSKKDDDTSSHNSII